MILFGVLEIKWLGTVGARRAQLLREVRALIVSDCKVGAVKFYKERTGCSLLEAKRTVDALAKELVRGGETA